MIRNYEVALAKRFKDMVPGVREIRVSDEQMLLFDTPKLIYPACYIHREEVDWDEAVIIEAFDKPKSGFFYKFKQDYTATVVLEKQEEALSFIKNTRFTLYKDPYIKTTFDNVKLTVGLWLKYIKLVSKRDNANEKGPRREVSIAWSSYLFMGDTEESKSYKGFKLIVTAANTTENFIIEEYD